MEGSLIFFLLRVVPLQLTTRSLLPPNGALNERRQMQHAGNSRARRRRRPRLAQPITPGLLCPLPPPPSSAVALGPPGRPKGVQLHLEQGGSW